MFADDLPIPLIIYRVHLEEAHHLGVLGQAVSKIDDLRHYTEVPKKSGMLPVLKPIAAHSNAAGIAMSKEEGCLWLLHPQLGELRPYRGRPPLLALENACGFYEAYLPHTSSAVPHEWYRQEQLCELAQHEDLAAPWLGSEEKQALLGVLLKHFYFWKKLNRSLLRPRAMPSSLKEAEQLLQRAYSGTAAVAKLPLRGKKQSSQAWLSEAQAALSSLASVWGSSAEKPGNSGGKATSQKAAEYLAQGIWALLAFWVSAFLRPAFVLGKLSNWLRVELRHQQLYERELGNLEMKSRDTKSQKSPVEP